MAIHYNASIPTDGLSLYLDAANPKSWSQNTFPSALDIYTWYVTKRGNNTGNFSTYSQDTTTPKSPANGIPMKMSVTGNDPHIGSYSAATWNIAPAVSGQTWILSVWAKASVNTAGTLYLFGADATGVASNGVGGWWNITSKAITITTEWQRFDHFLTITDANVAYIQMRLDGPESGGTGIDVWWDGLQMEKAESSTALSDFNPRHNENGVNWVDLVGTNNCVMTDCNYNAASKSMVFNGSSSFGTMTADVTNSNVGSTMFFVINKNDSVYRTLFIKDNGGFTNMIELNTSNGFRTEANSNENYFNSPNSISTTSAWQAFAFKFTPDKKCYWYKDGNLVGVTTAYGTINAVGTRPVDHLFDSFIWRRIGDNSAYSSKYFGKLSLVTKYDRALLDGEITQIFSAIRNRYGI